MLYLLLLVLEGSEAVSGADLTQHIIVTQRRLRVTSGRSVTEE